MKNQVRKAVRGKTKAKPAAPFTLPYLRGPVKKGEVWRVTGRKGPLTIEVLEDIPDIGADDFFEARIVEGHAHFISDAYNLAQKVHGLGTEGTVLSFRTTLTDFLERVKN